MTLSRREKDDLDGVFDLLFSGGARDDTAAGSDAIEAPLDETAVSPLEVQAEVPAAVDPPVVACASCDPQRASAYFQIALTAGLDENAASSRAIAVAVPTEDSPLTRALAFAVSAHVLWLADDDASHGRARAYLAGLRWGRPGARVFVFGSQEAVEAVAGPLLREELEIVPGGTWTAGQPLPASFRSWVATLATPPVSLAWALDLVNARCA